VRLPYEWQAPGDEQVNASLEELRQMHATTETVERPIQEGDFVMTDIIGHKAKAAEGESALVDRPGFPVFIRPEGRKEDWPFEGFSRQLIGMAPGETKTISHKYPKDHEDDSLKGQTVDYVVTIKTIRGVSLPELNDDFAKMVGSFESLAALRDVVRASLAQQSKAEYDNEYYMNVIDKIKEGATVKYPPQVLEHEVEHVLEDLEQRLSSQGLDMEAYIKSREMEREKYIEEEVKPIAIRRLERGLIMEEIGKAEKIQVSDEALQTSFQQTYGEVASNDQFQKNLRGKQPSRQMVNAIAMESAGRAVTQLTLERLKEIATGEAARKAKEEKKAAEKKAAGKATETEGEAEAKPKKAAKSKAPAGEEKAPKQEPAEAGSEPAPKKRANKKTEPKTEEPI
jgi:trigger factor